MRDRVLIERGTLIAVCAHVDLDESADVFVYPSEQLVVTTTDGNPVNIPWLMMCVACHETHGGEGSPFNAVVAVAKTDLAIIDERAEKVRAS